MSLYIVLDDVGFAALGCYGSPVCKTPHLDKLAAGGVRYNNFHTTALCSPSRSCFLTGRNHHSNAMAGITEISTGYPGYNGRVPLSHGLLSEMLTPFGWAAFAIGKWHLTPAEDMSLAANRKWWPLGRGFDRYYGFLGGDTDQYYPVAHLRQPLRQAAENAGGRLSQRPRLDGQGQGVHRRRKTGGAGPPVLPVLTAPAPAMLRTMSPRNGSPSTRAPSTPAGTIIAKKPWPGRSSWAFARRAPSCRRATEFVPEWAKLSQGREGSCTAHQMEVYAAYLSYVDHYVGELVAFLQEIGQLDNTLIITVSDNGASSEGGPNGSFSEILFLNNVPQTIELSLKHLKEWGGPNTYCHYSWGWAFATNTPFRKWKQIVTRGGTSDLCIVHWPKGIKAKGEIRHQFVHAIDLVPTTLDVLKLKMPASINGVAQAPIEGVSFAQDL